MIGLQLIRLGWGGSGHQTLTHEISENASYQICVETGRNGQFGAVNSPNGATTLGYVSTGEFQKIALTPIERGEGGERGHVQAPKLHVTRSLVETSRHAKWELHKSR